jgi:hypothetical protein
VGSLALDRLTTAGVHNHLGPKTARNPFVEGLLIEDGHGAEPVAVQLAVHVHRVFVSEGRDAASALVKRLLVAKGFDAHQFHAELVARNLMAPETAAKVRALEEFVPSGRTN